MIVAFIYGAIATVSGIAMLISAGDNALMIVSSLICIVPSGLIAVGIGVGMVIASYRIGWQRRGTIATQRAAPAGGKRPSGSLLPASKSPTKRTPLG